MSLIHADEPASDDKWRQKDVEELKGAKETCDLYLDLFGHMMILAEARGSLEPFQIAMSESDNICRDMRNLR